MLNFYSGPSGRSFTISWIFATRYGSGNSMTADIGMGWKSPIPVGSYVVISYGLPSDTQYDNYLKVDLTQAPTDELKRSYNSTLWQKVYDEKQSQYNGINYEFICAMTGNTPKIEFITPIEVLDADEPPEIVYDKTKPDNPTILLKLPRSQVLSLNQPIEVLDANKNPYVIYDEGSKDAQGNIIPGPHGGTINNPTLSMGIPQSQQIQQGTINWIKANENPRFTIDSTNINRPVFNFWLPVAQQIQQGAITILDADENPRFEIDSTDPDKPILKFWLPQSQIMQDPTTTIIGPDQDPSVSLDDTNINKPKLEFELPRAVKFYYGSLLGERQDSQYTLTNLAFADYGIGDYYINEASGFIYQVISKTGNTCTFKYIASIQQPLPAVNTTPISPYKADKTQNNPKVTRAFTNNNQTEWMLTFELPKIPLPDIEVEYIGSAEDGSASVAPSDENTMLFDFKIPTGSRMFAGDLVDAGKQDAVVPDAKPGDLYLNAQTGLIYILDKTSSIWNLQKGSLKGPVGDALHIIDKFSLTVADGFEDNIPNAVGVIQAQYPTYDRHDGVFAVTWKDVSKNTETSYWYFLDETDQWGRVQLTGGVMNLIQNQWVDSPETNPVTNQTYSIDYINKLIGGNIDDPDKDKHAFSKDQIYEMLKWGTWEEAISGIVIPDPADKDTLSKEEFLELASWGSFASLIIT